MQRRTLLAGLTVASLAAIAYARKAFRGRRESSLTSAEREAIRERYFPNVVLTTHLGKEVRFYDDLIKGKIVTINLMFTTCPKVCPRITENLVKVQKLHQVFRDSRANLGTGRKHQIDGHDLALDQVIVEPDLFTQVCGQDDVGEIALSNRLALR